MVKLFKFLTLLSFALFVWSCGTDGTNFSSGGAGTKDDTKLSPQRLEGSEIPIASSTNDQKNPHAVYLQDKRLWFVVYEDWSSGYSDIKAKFLKEDGTICGDEITITNSLGNQTFPRVAYKDANLRGDNTSILAIVWQDSLLTDSSGNNAYVGLRALNVFNIDSNCSNASITFSNIVPIPATDAMNHRATNRQTPKIEYNPSTDRFILAWIEVDNNEKGIVFNGYIPPVRVCGYRAFNYLKIIENLNLNNVGSISISSLDIKTLPPIQKKVTQTTTDDTREYDIVKNINSFDFKCDNTTNECLFAFAGKIDKLTAKYEYTTPAFSCDFQEGTIKVYGIYKSRISYKDSNDGNGDFEYLTSLDNTLLEISDTSSLNSQNPAVGFGRSQISGGGYLVVWEDYRNVKPKIYGQVLLSSRGMVGGNILISYTDNNLDGANDDNVQNSNQTHPYVDFDLTNERFFVIWQDGRNGSQSAENLDIYGQYVDMEGSLRGSNYQINGNPANQYSPVVTYNNTVKHFLAVWTDARNLNTNNADIYGQRFSLGMPQLTILNPDNTPLEPAFINFGSVTTGRISTRTIKLRNTGDAVINIDCAIGLNLPFQFENLPNSLSACGDSNVYVLQPGTEVNITVSFRPTTNGVFNGSFTIQTDAGNKTIYVQGEAVSPVIKISVDNQELTTLNIDYGLIRKGSSSDKFIMITNTGTADYNITNISGVNAPFSIVEGLRYPITLRAGESLSFTLRFSGNERGYYETNLNIQTDVGLSQTVNVKGRVIAPVLRVVENILDFGTVKVNTASSKTITVKNEGDDTLTITSVTYSGQYFSVRPYTDTVPAGGQITITVDYAPTALGNHTGSVNLTTNAGNATVSLSGSGKGGQASISPAQIDFGTIPTNVTRIQSLTIKNTGNDNLVVSGISSDNTAFTITCSGICPSITSPITIAPNGQYTVNVSVSSSTEGVKQGTLTIITDGVGGNVSTSLYAVVVAPRIEIEPSGGILDFGSISTSTESTSRVTIKNTGTIDVIIENIDLPTEPFSLVNVPSLPYTLTAGQKLELLVKFRPTNAGTYSSVINLLTNHSLTPIQIILKGSAITSSTNSGLYIAYNSSPISIFMFQEYVLIGQSLSATLKIVNPLSSSVKIVSVSSSNPEFVVSTNLFADIPPSGQDMVVTFIPRETGLRKGAITLTDSNNNTIVLTVQGYGTKIKLLSPSISYSLATLPISGKPSDIAPVDAILMYGVNSNEAFSFTVEAVSLPENPKYYIVYNNTWTEITPSSVSGNRLSFSLPPQNLGSIDLTFVVARTLSSSDTSFNPPPTSSMGNLDSGGCSMTEAKVGAKGALLNMFILLSFVLFLFVKKVKSLLVDRFINLRKLVQ